MTETPPPAATDGDARPEGGERPAGRPDDRWGRVRRRLARVHPASWVFAAAVVATVPLILFHYGRHQWFLRDEWFLLTDNEGFPPLLRPNAGVHLVAIPRIIYRVLWEIWGVRTYRPYAMANLALHLLLVVMLRSIMRRSGVGPWLATAAAVPMLLFGPGEEGILLAFQVGFTGSLAWGFTQLVLADSDGPDIVRRDYLALAAGFLAITSSGIGVTTTVMVAMALLVRRGWKAAAFQSVPLGIFYAAWMKLEHVSTSQAAGRPSLSQIMHWDWWSVKATILGIGHFRALSIVYVALVVVAAVLVIGPWRDRPWGQFRRDLAFPVAMAVSVVFFASSTALGRYYMGPGGATSTRYVYLQAALTVPLLGVSAQLVARRWKQFTPVLTPVLAVLLLIPVPFNTRQFGHSYFGAKYYAGRRYILTTAVRMPFAHDVPPGVRPVPDPFDGEGLTIGFLLRAEAEGKLVASTIPLTDPVVNEMRLRLGFALNLEPIDRRPHDDCIWAKRPEISPRKGQTYEITGDVRMWTVGRAGGPPTSSVVIFHPESRDRILHMTATLPDLELRIAPLKGRGLVMVCTVAEPR